MGATPEQYKDWRRRANQGTLYFSEILEELPSNQWFALGAISSWLFIGNKEMFNRDMDTLDEIYYRMMTGEKTHVMFLMQKVGEVYIRHWEGEHLLILITLEGDEEGYISFERDYPTFIELCKMRMANNQKLPKSITFDKEGKIVKRVMARNKKGIPHARKVIIYNLEGDEIGRYPSVTSAAAYIGIPWRSLDRILRGERKHPYLRFEYADKEGKAK